MTATTDNSRETVSIQDKVEFLSKAASYGPHVAEVETRETHMSWVFLAGDRVYKLKKPVRYPLLDFTTLGARETDCRAEIRLNRRLAPDVYLGIVRLVLERTGTLALDGEGETVDWLVVMRRLPEGRMLDNVIAQGAVNHGEIERVAGILAEFYRHLGPAEVSPDEHVALFARQQRGNREMLKDARFSLAGAMLDNVLASIDNVLDREPQLLTVRVQEGRIVEGHGDLRPEHICLCEPPVVIDCLEFNRTLRLVDPFDELADLAMECERLGAPWVGEMLIDRCAADLDDRPRERLMAFYTTYRTCLRARLAVRHLLDREVREPQKWPPLARQYLEIAERASLRLHPQAGRQANHSRGSAE